MGEPARPPDPAVLARDHQALFDELWDFADPATSEVRLRAAAEDPANAVVRPLLLTQVARAVALGGRFQEASALRDDVEAAATGDAAPAASADQHATVDAAASADAGDAAWVDTARITSAEVLVRVYVERGRVLNSSGAPADARPLFEAAFKAAVGAGFEHLAIDALHMVSIVATAGDQVALTEQALSLARAASDPRARDWRASLLNNLGWTRFEAGELQAALALFQEAVDERVRMGKEREIGVARWCVARTYRAMGRYVEALEVQEGLASWLLSRSMPDSFVEEEIGECLVALGRHEDAAQHFGAAAQLLNAGGAGEVADADRLARLRALEKDHARPG